MRNVKCKRDIRMAKLKSDPITKDDILEYLNEYSDFTFEVSVLRKLNSFGFSCEHAGTYEDPITKKTREFDIRARKTVSVFEKLKLNICLSVECKNLKPNFPLVVHCMPREENECYLDLIWSSEPSSYIPPYENSLRVPLSNDDCPYEKLMAVGKSSDQVGRKLDKSEITGNDGDVFEKISQAINSAYDLIKEAHYAADKNTDVASIVLPVLVVPNERVWSIWYKRNGEIEREPTIESNIEYYIDKSWLVGHPPSEFKKRFFLSHLEIVQIDGIQEMLNKYERLSCISSFEDLCQKKLQILEDRAR